MTDVQIKKFAKKIVGEGRMHLRIYLNDVDAKNTRLGIPFSKKTMKKIKEYFKAIEEEAKEHNIIVTIDEEHDGYIFFEYEFKYNYGIIIF